MFNNFKPGLLMKRTNSSGRASLEAGSGSGAAQDSEKEAFVEKKTGEYGDTQFWEKNDMGYDLDELLADMA